MTLIQNPSSQSLQPTGLAELPSYSETLPRGERLLDRTLLVSQRPNGDYSRRCGRETLILRAQEDGVEVPLYGPGSHVVGAILVEDPATVSGVILQVRGKMEVTVTGRGCMTATTLRESYIMWPGPTRGPICPATVSFSLLLPVNFCDDNRAIHRLPPSYDMALPGLFMKSAYWFVISVTRNDPRFHFLSIEKTMSVPFHYRQGSRTWRCPRALRGFLAEIKLIPGQWRQTVLSFESVEISLFLPSASVLDLKDDIPFHVQLTGPVFLLRHLHANNGLLVQCFIERDITANMHGRPITRSISIGHGNLLGSTEIVQHVLSWDGELRCNPDVHVGAFDGGLIKVQDFFVLELRPGEIEDFLDFKFFFSYEDIQLFFVPSNSHPSKDLNSPSTSSALSELVRYDERTIKLKPMSCGLAFPVQLLDPIVTSLAAFSRPAVACHLRYLRFVVPVNCAAISDVPA
ncbi:hypothetical protein B0H17DRAFT_1324376 [Mycena rosella]|uniref:Uncharacterized protein n=1 Tax=Mycena rosella TaxID=1033263 RepID=A0AAD7MCR8_MYCRO|nr:hypothetical protein B0H17DRAFT_1324376 [Mycena rosella]